METLGLVLRRYINVIHKPHLTTLMDTKPKLQVISWERTIIYVAKMTYESILGL